VFRWKSRPALPSQKFPLTPFTLLRPFLTPKLVSLEVQLAYSSDAKYQLFLENYPTLSPNLRSIRFKLFSGMANKPVSQALSRSICTNPNWEHVELSPPIDNVGLKHLGMSSTLKTVSLILASQTSQLDKTCFGPEDTPFRCVTDLALILDSFNFATCLLRPHDQVFRSLNVVVHTPTVATEASTFISALASPQRRNSLQSIIVRDKNPYVVPRVGISTSDWQGIRVRQPLSYKTFHPLVSLVHLRKLVIDLDHPTSLNDEEFAGLVCNWPVLEVFQMMSACGEHPAPLITLKGLLSLLVSCRKLRTIGLTLDARDVPSGAYADVCSPSVTSPIRFHNSPIKHPDLVTEFLLKHLPSVPCVFNSWCDLPIVDPIASDNLEYKLLWLQVNTRIDRPLS
jgi:hypothetical protein